VVAKETILPVIVFLTLCVCGGCCLDAKDAGIAVKKSETDGKAYAKKTNNTCTCAQTKPTSKTRER
jgi:hypothetical protein